MRPPEQHGSMLLCLCDTCRRMARYIIHDHADGSQSYELSVFGGDAELTVTRTFRMPARIADEVIPYVKGYIKRKAK